MPERRQAAGNLKFELKAENEMMARSSMTGRTARRRPRMATGPSDVLDKWLTGVTTFDGGDGLRR